jgi:hypothetical protein
MAGGPVYGRTSAFVLAWLRHDWSCSAMKKILLTGMNGTVAPVLAE